MGGYTYDKSFTYSKTRISKVMDFKNGSTFHNISYGYDALGRMTSESDSTDTNFNNTYVYDTFGRLIQENNKALDKTFIFKYNDNGNIIGCDNLAYTTENVSNDSVTVTHVYDSTIKDRLVKFNNISISYDANGCPTYYNGRNYTWTKGRLTRIHCGASQQPGSLYADCKFTYDAYGRRLSKSYAYDPNPASTSDYSYSYNTTYNYDNSGRLVREYCIENYISGTTNTREITYLYDEAGIIGAIQTFNSLTETFYFDRNIKGDVIALYNSSGTKVASYNYDAWGNCIAKTIVVNNFSTYNPIRYRGYYYDRESELYYLNARYYNPQWRRFISPDDTAYIDPETPNGLNLYCYCNNDPVNYADPSGHFPVLAAILCGVALVGMGLTIGGVVSDNNLMTAIGLTMVAVPALISGGIAIATGISGATLTGIIGGGTAIAGIGTGLFASAEYQEAFTGNNWMLDAGMSEGWYNGLMLTTATLATLGTFASSFAYSFRIDSIKEFWKLQGSDYKGIKFIQQTKNGKFYRSLEFHYDHVHKGHKLHWQLNKWSKTGTHLRGGTAWWSMLLRRL